MGGGSNHYIRAEKQRKVDEEDQSDDEDKHCCDRPCWRSKTYWLIAVLTIIAIVAVTLIATRRPQANDDTNTNDSDINQIESTGANITNSTGANITEAADANNT